jgi:hypothetical protein
MTVPAFPTQFGGGAIMDPGAGAALAGSVAQVLAAQQQQRENEFRMQQLAQAQAQQEALAQYYQGTIGVQQQQEQRLMAEAQAQARGKAQVGNAQLAALGIGQPSASTTRGVFQETLQSGAQAVAPAMQSIFGGVSPENVPDAVKGVQEAQALQPKAPELPTAAQEFIFAAGLNPDMQKMFIENWVNPKKDPTTIVNVGGEPTPFSKKYDESRAEGAVAASTAANEAFRSLPIIDEAYQTLTKGKVLTGLFSKPSLQVARMAAAMGVPDAQIRAADTQTMLKLTGEMTFVYLRSRDLGSGTAVSDGDREFVFGLSGRDLSQDKLALTRTLRINYGAALMKQADALAQLKTEAVNFPERSAQIGRDVTQIERKHEAGWTTYARMLKQEGHSDDEIRTKLITAGVRTADQIMKTISGVKPDIKGMGDAIFGGPNGVQ